MFYTLSHFFCIILQFTHDYISKTFTTKKLDYFISICLLFRTLSEAVLGEKQRKKVGMGKNKNKTKRTYFI